MDVYLHVPTLICKIKSRFNLITRALVSPLMMIKKIDLGFVLYLLTKSHGSYKARVYVPHNQLYLE